ncbi:unnamed protein product [Camellia sinensis]
MAAKQVATVSVRILVDEEKKRVVCAETGNDFVDFLFGFLTLPMGTIVQFIRKNRSELGSMSNLYRSVEANFSLDNFWTNVCMDILLHPRTPLETICRGLKINVNDSEPTRYFICSDLECSRKQNVGLFSNYANSICKCGKLMNKEIFALTSASNTRETDGVFVTRSTAYIVSDSFKIIASTPGVLVELLRNTSIKDLNCLEERVVKVGSEEEPGVTLSLAEAIILPADRDIRRAEDDALAIARVVQLLRESPILDVIFVMLTAAADHAIATGKAAAEHAKAKEADLFRQVAEKRANTFETSYKAAEEELKRVKRPALNLKKASLITTSALTSVLNLHLKKPKQES